MKRFKELAMIIGGTTIFAIGIAWFAEPLELVTGGVTGVAIIIKQLTQSLVSGGIPLSITNFVLNIPLFLISIKQRGFSFARKSLYSVIWMSISLWLVGYIPNFLNIGQDIFLASVLCGVFSGIGIGLVLRTSATTGGTDMLASIIQYRHHHFPIALLMFILDGIIILSGLFIFGAEKAMYAVISILISAKLISSILEGMHFAKAVFIMSKYNDKISDSIFNELERGNTGISARGMYTKEEFEMLLVIVSTKEITRLQKIVRQNDPSAFIIITDVKEVLGEGFQETKSLI